MNARPRRASPHGPRHRPTAADRGRPAGRPARPRPTARARPARRGRCGSGRRLPTGPKTPARCHRFPPRAALRSPPPHRSPPAPRGVVGLRRRQSGGPAALPRRVLAPAWCWAAPASAEAEAGPRCGAGASRAGRTVALNRRRRELARQDGGGRLGPATQNCRQRAGDLARRLRAVIDAERRQQPGEIRHADRQPVGVRRGEGQRDGRGFDRRRRMPWHRSRTRHPGTRPG